MPFRRLICLWGCVLLLCALPFSTAAAQESTSVTEIEFKYSPPWSDETLVYLARFPDGAVRGSVHTRAEDIPVLVEEGRPVPPQPRRKWQQVKEITVAADDFARLEAAFEAPEVKKAAERDWSVGPDTTGWCFKKRVGSRTIEINAWNLGPGPEAAPLMKLARAFVAIAGLPKLPEEEGTSKK